MDKKLSYYMLYVKDYFNILDLPRDLYIYKDLEMFIVGELLPY